MTEMTPWYLISINAHRVHLLHRLGLESFCPVEVNYRHTNGASGARRGAKIAVEKPLFGRWMWIRGPSAGHFWRMLGAVNLIHRIDGHMGWPRAWDNDQVERIRQAYPKSRHTAADHTRFMQSYHEFDVGDRVVLDHPAMAGFEGRVIDINGEVSEIELELAGLMRKVQAQTGLLKRA